jgi:uncharacterized protein (TIGR00255 family)
MTGFGRAAFTVEGASFEVEVRSTNHRYLDLRVRLPRQLAESEAEVRSRVGARFARGKVDVSVQLPPGGPRERLAVDLDAAARYLEAAAALRSRHHLAGRLEVGELLSLPGVSRLVEAELPAESLQRAMFEALEVAVERADAMRGTEGAALERELRDRIGRVAVLAQALDGRAGAVREAARERLRRRAEKLSQETGLLDEARLYQEIAMAADRLDVTEELVRLASHVEQFLSTLGEADAGRPVGRRLDFLLQELGREANTLGAKVGDADAAHMVVELKTELERVREQVQNVE